MSSVFNTNLVFDDYYDGNYVVPGGYRYYWSWDAVVLYGAGVNFSDQQHNNNKGPNYFSYFVKRVRLNGRFAPYVSISFPAVPFDFKLTVVLYKCPAKYENGRLVPIHTKGFINLEEYILYSDPECVLAWGVFPDFYKPGDFSVQEKACNFDVSLSCNKPFILGPNDLICCNFFVDHDDNRYVRYTGGKPEIDAKVVFDIN